MDAAPMKTNAPPSVVSSGLGGIDSSSPRREAGLAKGGGDGVGRPGTALRPSELSHSIHKILLPALPGPRKLRNDPA